MEKGEVARGRVLKVHEVQRCVDVVASCTFLIVCVCVSVLPGGGCIEDGHPSLAEILVQAFAFAHHLG